jgi:hypothetical protein
MSVVITVIIFAYVKIMNRWGWAATGAKAARKIDKAITATKAIDNATAAKVLKQNTKIGKEGEKIVTEVLEKEFQDKKVLKQVTGKFEDGQEP